MKTVTFPYHMFTSGKSLNSLITRALYISRSLRLTQNKSNEISISNEVT